MEDMIKKRTLEICKLDEESFKCEKAAGVPTNA